MTVCFWTLSLTAGHDDPKRPIDGLAHRILGNMDTCFVFVYQSDSVDYFLIEPVELPVEFPTPSKTIHKEALVRDCFFLNYCTYGYTMPLVIWSFRPRKRARSSTRRPLARNSPSSSTSGQRATRSTPPNRWN